MKLVKLIKLNGSHYTLLVRDEDLLKCLAEHLQDPKIYESCVNLVEGPETDSGIVYGSVSEGKWTWSTQRLPMDIVNKIPIYRSPTN